MNAWAGVVAAWLASTGAAWAQPEHLPFVRLPRQIQQEIVAHDVRCGIPAALARTWESADAGPIGGPGRRDYHADETDGYFRPPANAVWSYDPRCVGNYAQGSVWMRLSSGRFRKFTYPYLVLYYDGRRVLLQTPDLHCSAEIASHHDWEDCVHFLAWDARAERFRPFTLDMTSDEADAWAAKRGFRRFGG